MESLYEKADSVLIENFGRTVDLRRELHMYPETEFEEEKTAEIIAKELENIGVSYQSKIAKTGIKAVIHGGVVGDEKKCILLRADIDALSVEEKNDVLYKSKNKGKMHACGHDAHTAVLLSVIRALNEIKDEICGDMVFVFQPAEEGAGGAKPMIDEGVLNNPEVCMAIGLHVEPTFETGSVAIKSGSVMASPDEFDIVVKGRGGHGAYREKCTDPIYVASKIVCELIDFGEKTSENESECVISIGEISGGNFYNIIPDTVRIKGTSRAVSFEKRKILSDGIYEISRAVCQKYKAECDVDFRFMYPPLINDEKMVKIFSKSAGDLKLNLIKQKKAFMGGDDFAYFAENVPSAYCFLGCGNKEKDCVYPWHSNRFNIDEDCLLHGGRLLVRTVINALMGKEEIF